MASPNRIRLYALKQLESAARNPGLTRQVPHDERYVIAEEFMEVVYRLWEASWQDNAVVADRPQLTDHDSVGDSFAPLCRSL